MATARLTLLIDGDCPLCRAESEFLRRLDRGRARLAFENIAAPDFDAGRYGLTRAAVMGQIHALRPDGAIVTGMEAFRQAYAALGWGWLLAPTAWSGIRPLVDRLYRWFARNRLRLTGRRAECTDGQCRAR